MKTIFITISDGEVSKSILQSDIFRLLKGKLKIVLLVHPRSLEHYSQVVGTDAVVEAMPLTSLERINEFFNDLFLYSVHTKSILVKIRHSYASGGSLLGKWIKYLLWFFGAWHFYRAFWRWVYMIIPDRSLEPLFVTHQPVLVFAANLTSLEDARLLKTARRYGVKSIGMPKGWDNLTLKTFLPVFPDKLLVQTSLMKEDAQRLDVLPQNITVVGFPKFDVYADTSVLTERDVFLQKLGLNKERKLILYAGAGDQLAPHDEDILAAFLGAVKEGTILGAPNVLVRPHPKYRYRVDILPEGNFWKLDKPGKPMHENGADFVFERDDIVHLMNSLYHCDVLIHTASTLGVEAAIFDRPAITIAYDGPAQVPSTLSTARYYEYEHLNRVIVTGGMKMAYTFSELLDYTNAYLSNPELDREGRLKIVKENAHLIDGKAGERVVSEIFALCQ